MALRTRTTLYDPARWAVAVESIQNVYEVMGVYATEMVRLRLGLPIVVSGDVVWRDGDSVELLHEPYVCLEPDGGWCLATPLREVGLIIDYHRADGTLVGYTDLDAPGMREPTEQIEING